MRTQARGPRDWASGQGSVCLTRKNEPIWLQLSLILRVGEGDLLWDGAEARIAAGVQNPVAEGADGDGMDPCRMALPAK